MKFGGRRMTMVRQSWKIYWNEYAKDTYIYGTELFFHAKNDIEFKNELMPPENLNRHTV